MHFQQERNIRIKWYPSVSKAEWACLSAHGETVIQCIMTQTALPPLILKDIIAPNFRYHGIDLRNFFAHMVKGRILMSRIYRWKGHYYITLRIAQTQGGS